MSNNLLTVFPNLGTQNHRITSRKDPSYNCVAWAVEDTSLWWDHIGGFWPEGLTRDASVETYVELFRLLGFELSDSGNPVSRRSRCTVERSHTWHSGNWTSKLGALEDIEHTDLESLADSSYGRPLLFMRRAMNRVP